MAAPTKIQTSIVFQLLQNSNKRITVLQGGSRSSKTYNTILWFIVKLLQERGKTLTIVRQSMPSIKGSVLRDFIEILLKMNLYSEDNHNKTEQTYNLNGNLIEFVSVDQPHKIRGRKRTYLFMNEVTEMSFEAWIQLSIRTEDKIVLDYNPSDEYHWVFDKVIPREDADFHITTYKDNPFLSKELIEEIERLKDADENYWLVYGLGQKGNQNDTIYTHWKPCKTLPEGETVYGLDFGFNNPSALVKVVFHDGAIYADEVLYETKLTTNDLVERINLSGISRYDEIFCDSAEPKTIEELVRCGYNAKPSNKDVFAGIQKIKSLPLFVTESSVNLIKELRNYKWKTDKNGKRLDEPVKFNDHACFVGSTMITTNEGLKRIDKIKIGDKVLTSSGYRNVNDVYNNGKHLVNMYLMQFDTFVLTLICTPNHLIKTNEGWKEISKLQSGQTVYLNNFIEENLSSYNQEKDILTMVRKKCTGMFGKQKLLKKDQKVSIYTTLTETLGIIKLKTFNLLKVKSIYQNMQKKGSKITQTGLKNSMKKELRLHQNGINLKQGLNGIGNTQKDVNLDTLTMGCQIANNVVKNTIKKHYTQNFVIQTAKLLHLESVENWKEEVYDLNVDIDHEYFANGLLVHNCDGLRYCVYTKLNAPQLTWGMI